MSIIIENNNINKNVLLTISFFYFLDNNFKINQNPLYLYLYNFINFNFIKKLKRGKSIITKDINRFNTIYNNIYINDIFEIFTNSYYHHIINLNKEISTLKILLKDIKLDYDIINISINRPIDNYIKDYGLIINKYIISNYITFRFYSLLCLKNILDITSLYAIIYNNSNKNYYLIDANIIPSIIQIDLKDKHIANTIKNECINIIYIRDF